MGATAIPGPDLNDTWFAPPPPAQIVNTLTPFGLISVPAEVNFGKITMQGQICAFPANSPTVQAWLGTFRPPKVNNKNNTRQFWYYTGSNVTPSVAPKSFPAMTPGTLTSSGTAVLKPNAAQQKAGLKITDVWNTQWVACETNPAGNPVYHQETVKFNMGTIVRDRNGAVLRYTAPVVQRVPQPATTLFPSDATSSGIPRRTRESPHSRGHVANNAHLDHF